MTREILKKNKGPSKKFFVKKAKETKKFNIEKAPTLDGNKLQKAILKSLICINKLSFFERYAVFMGKAQIVEASFNRLLIQKYNYKEEDFERCTLGAAINMLETAKSRPDFIVFAETVK